MIKYNTLIEVIKKRSNCNKKGIIFISEDQDEKFLLYSDLYSKSLQMLYYLQQKGLKPKDELVMQIEDNEMFLSMFWACILGGIIPVPLTVGKNSEQRYKLLKIWSILNNPYLIVDDKSLCQLKDYIESSEIKSDITDFESRILNLEKIRNNNQYGLIYKAMSNDICFIQFSSGSTGEPKGVMLTHANLLVNINAIINGSNITSVDSFMSWMPLTHDMGLIGCHLVPITCEINQFIMPTTLFIRRPTLWIKITSDNNITILSSPNFGYRYFLNFFKPEVAIEWDLSHIRLIYNGAEPISTDLCNEFLAKLSKYGLKRTTMFTVYGMAEACVALAFPPLNQEFKSVTLNRNYLKVGMEVEESTQNDKNCITFVDVGFPVNDCYIRICNEYDELLGDSIVGHIQIKGKNVTKGYYNNKKVTEESFTKDEWLRTGDLGYFKKGRLIVTGRQKDILFVNGQNIYPHDIERVCEELQGVIFGGIAACGIYNNELQCDEIVLFVRFRKELNTFIQLERKIKEHLYENCGWEIGKIIPVKKIPKTTSGKVQRYKLAEYYLNGEYETVLSELEVNKTSFNNTIIKEVFCCDMGEKLIDIVKEILNVAVVDMNDSLFELGAHSLKIIYLVENIHREFDVEISVVDIFELKTIVRILEYISNAPQSKHFSIYPAPKAEYYPVSSAQKRLFVMSQLDDRIGTSYNLPIVMTIEGKLSRNRLEKAFIIMIDRHEILRTSFKIVNEEPVQVLHESIDFQLTYMEVSQMEVKKVIKGFIKNHNIEKPPLMRAGIIKTELEKYIFILDIHHIIADGTSVIILLKELMALYDGKELEQPQIHYKDFTVWQHYFQESQLIKSQEKYWLEKMSGEIPSLDLNTDYPRGLIKSFEGNEVYLRINTYEVKELREIALKSGATLYMVLMAIFNILLYKYTGQKDIIIGSGIAGRDHAGLSNVVGMFVNMLPIRNKIGIKKSFIDFLLEIKNNLLLSFENRQYQFEQIVEKLNIHRDSGRNPLFDVAFVLQNMDMPKLKTKDFTLSQYNYDFNISKFDITLYAVENADTIDLKFEYCKKLFKQESIKKLSEDFAKMVDMVISDKNIKISDINLIDKDQKEHISLNIKNSQSTLYIKELDF